MAGTHMTQTLWYLNRCIELNHNDENIFCTPSVPKYKNVFNTSIVSKTFLYFGTEGVVGKIDRYYSWVPVVHQVWHWSYYSRFPFFSWMGCTAQDQNHWSFCLPKKTNSTSKIICVPHRTNTSLDDWRLTTFSSEKKKAPYVENKKLPCLLKG